jgi:RNA polymerase sigma-70 factor (ECF subfamily)
MDMHDQTLLENALRGDRAAFETLIVQNQSAVYGYLRARLLQHSDAEDLTQEVFLRFYLARARFDTKQLIRPWLLGIARNLLREHSRKTRRLRQTAWTELCLELEELLKVETRETNEDVFVWLPECMSGLGDSARQAIDLHYSSNLRLAEIGEQLKRSEGAVKLLVFRARQALKRCLDQKIRTDGRKS